MPYKIISHTGDLRIVVTGKTIRELFSSALRGMMSYMSPGITKNSKPVQRSIFMKSPDKVTLLVDFLNEVLSLSQIYKEAYYKIKFNKITETKVEAKILGKRVKSFNEDIKAVTYHEADIQKNKKGEWQTTLVFDI